VNGAGHFLIPGLWDAHAHLSYPGECALQLMIAHGVTSVRDLGGPPGEGSRWREEISTGRRVGPRLFLAGLNIESASWMDDVERMITREHPAPEARIRRLWEQSPRYRLAAKRHARLAVDTAQRLGMDVVKFRNLGAGEFRAVARAARRSSIRLAGHAPQGLTLAEAAEAGLASIEHSGNLSSLAGLAPAARRQQYARMARSGVYITPTLVSDGMWAPDALVLATLSDTGGKLHPRNRTISVAQAEMWREAIQDRRAWGGPGEKGAHDSTFAVQSGWVREAFASGIPLLAGTDVGTLLTFPGSSLHDELALLVDRVGLTPREALRTATVHPARFFALAQELGTIAVGRRADMVLLRADPSRDIRNVRDIEGVVAAGRYFDADDIAEMKQCRAPAR
jgi:imidazolonepropionase-like amidohydrolase